MPPPYAALSHSEYGRPSAFKPSVDGGAFDHYRSASFAERRHTAVNGMLYAQQPRHYSRLPEQSVQYEANRWLDASGHLSGSIGHGGKEPEHIVENEQEQNESGYRRHAEKQTVLFPEPFGQQIANHGLRLSGWSVSAARVTAWGIPASLATVEETGLYFRCDRSAPTLLACRTSASRRYFGPACFLPAFCGSFAFFASLLLRF